MALFRSSTIRFLAIRILAIVSPAICTSLFASNKVAGESLPSTSEVLAYDEIGRVHIKPPAPPPDTFSADAARIASLPALPNSNGVYAAGQLLRTLGMNPLTAFAVAPAAAAVSAAVKVNQAQVYEVSQEYLNAGIIAHHWFYRDWTRTEVPVLHAASIVRPDLGTQYRLDLAKRTYRETPSTTLDRSEDTYTVSAADDIAIDFEKAPVVSPIDVKTLSGMSARGYRTEATFSLSSLLGWCSKGRHAVVEIEYVADVADPQTPVGSPLIGSQWAREACMPASAKSHREPGHLVLFRSTAISGNATNPDFVNVLERGNFLSTPKNDSLFAVPIAFTKEK